MSAKRSSKSRKGPNRRSTKSVWANILLTLTLLPLLVGIILIAASLIDFLFIDTLENQFVIGFVLVLGSFAASNTIQKKWILAAGWTSLFLAVDLLWFYSGLWIQIVAYVLGGLGAVLLVFEILRRVREKSV